MTTIVNLRNLPKKLGKLEYIDRTTRWGNQFKIGVHGNRKECIVKYKRWLWRKIQEEAISIDDLLSLEDKTLACWCKPLPCHGDILIDAIKWARRIKDAS